MNRLAFLFAASLTLAPALSLTAQDAPPTRRLKAPLSAAQQNAPILVAGSEFLILDPPAKPARSEKPKPRLPVIVVVLFWIFAMFLWQVYFNRKRRP
jgi:hypothetical protein